MNMIIPMLICRDATNEIAFCRQAFDAVETSRHEGDGGAVIHATMKIGGAMFMIHDQSTNLSSKAPYPDGSSSVVIYLYVDEVDLVIERAISNGARLLLPAEDKFWGDRVGRIIDPEHHIWNISSRVDKEDQG